MKRQLGLYTPSGFLPSTVTASIIFPRITSPNEFLSSEGYPRSTSLEPSTPIDPFTKPVHPTGHPFKCRTSISGTAAHPDQQAFLFVFCRPLWPQGTERSIHGMLPTLRGGTWLIVGDEWVGGWEPVNSTVWWAWKNPGWIPFQSTWGKSKSPNENVERVLYQT